jgi:hypothetical protein
MLTGVYGDGDDGDGGGGGVDGGVVIVIEGSFAMVLK